MLFSEHVKKNIKETVLIDLHTNKS